MSYNGWSNYETWAVGLWIGNEEGTYHAAKEMTSEADSVNDLADSAKEWVNKMAPDLGASVFADLLGAALSEVDWYEIAQSWWDDEHSDCTSENCDKCAEVATDKAVAP